MAGVAGRLALLPLLLLLLCASHRCAGAHVKMFLKRSPGAVDAICFEVPAGTPSSSFSEAQSMFVGSSKAVQAPGVACQPPVVVYTASSNFQPLSSLPTIIANTTFNSSVWTAAPSDTVSLTVENGIPRRPLEVLGAPMPMELSGPSPSNPAPTVATLDSQPASSYSLPFTSELAVLSSYLDWFFSLKKQLPNGLQAAIIILQDPSDQDGSTFQALYTMFTVANNGTVSGYLLVSSFDIPSGISTSPRRRLLSLRGASRGLLQYYSGVDSTGTVKRTGCPLVNGRRVCR